MEHVLLYAVGFAILVATIVLFQIVAPNGTRNFEITSAEIQFAIRAGKTKPRTLREKLLHKLGWRM